jgi:hypothetical protein
MRLYLHGDNYYLFRDYGHGQPQYATVNAGEIEWHDIVEGVELTDVQPIFHKHEALDFAIPWVDLSARMPGTLPPT